MKVAVSPERAELAPGQDIELAITVANDGQQVLTPVFGVSGVDPSLVTLPDAAVGVAPGQRVTTVVGVRVPEDAVPGEQRLGVSVADAEGQHRPVAAVVVVRVGARPDVAVEVDPPAVRGRRKARFTTVLRNRADEPQVVQLDGSGAGVSVRFAADEIVLEPREEVHVRTTVRRTEHTWIREVRHGALIDVRGTGMPVSTTATFTQKPLVPVWWRKLVAVIAAFALWAGVVVAVDRYMDRDDPAGDLIAGDEDEDADADAPGDGEGDGEEEPAGRPYMIQGTIDGPREPIGTTVVVERLAFGDAGTTDGDGDSKIAPLTPIALPTVSVLDKIETTTVDGGRFRFRSGLQPEAFYRVTASRVGFDTQSQVVNLTVDEPEVDIDLQLEPSSGAMSGRVVDQSGAGLGEVEVIVTDGDLVYHTLTDTAGNVGAWTLSGLNTPATYQIITTLEGYSTATTIVELDAGGSLSGVTSRMSLGLGTIRGEITDDTDAGIGGIEVTAVGDEAERMTSTLTDPGLAGRFTLPGLPLGTYELTFRGEGFQTQSAVVELTSGDVVVPRRRMSVSTAELFGVVALQVAPGGGCAYPDPDIPEQRENAVLQVCGGVGVTLDGEQGVFSTTTDLVGGFRTTGVPPGDYTLSFERYGYYPEHFAVTLGANDRIHVPASMLGGVELEDLPDELLHPVLRRTSARGADDPFANGSFEETFQLRDGDFIALELLPAPTDEVGEIQGVLRDSRDPGEILDHFDTRVFPTPPVIVVDEQPNAEVELLADGGFKISRLLPGAHTVRIIAPGYDVDTFVARVGRDQAADAGSRLLIPFGSLNLRVTDGLDFAIPNADVFLTTPDPALVGRLNPDNADPVYDVRSCTVSRDAAGRWREGEAGLGEDVKQGLCATVTEEGDAQFNQALPTGRYELIVPVNEVDTAESDDPAVRATTGPLDHEQVSREIDMRSGETARPDLRLRRYAIVEGRLLEPTEEAYRGVTDDVFGAGRLDDVIAAFPQRLPSEVGVELRSFANGQPYETPEGLGPRLSFGEQAGLLEGNYRIDRILPDEAGITRQYELVFRAADESQARFLLSNDTAIEGLSHGSRRVLNAVLSPRALNVDLGARWIRLDGSELPVTQFSAELSGLTELRLDAGDGGDSRETIRIPADSFTGRATTVGRFFGGDPDRPAEFLEGEPLSISLVYNDDIATHFVDFGTRTFRPRVSEDASLWVRDFELEPSLRTVLGLISVPVGGPDTDRAFLEGLDIRLQPITGPLEPNNTDPGQPMATGLIRLVPEQLTGNAATGRLQLDLPGVRPERYRMEVRGEGIFEHTTPPFAVMPGDPNQPVRLGRDGVGSETPIVIDRQIDLTVGVFERFDEAWDGNPAVEPAFTTTPPQPVSDALVTLLLNGEIPADIVDNDLFTGPEGLVTFETLRGGDARAYTAELSVAGYLDGAFELTNVRDFGSQLLADLNADVDAPILTLVDNRRAVEVQRHGELAGTVTSLVDVARGSSYPSFNALVAALGDATDRFEVGQDDLILSGPTGGARIDLLPADSDTPLASAELEVVGGEARYAFDNTLGLTAGTYRLRITAADHEDLIIDGVQVRDGRRTITPVYLPLERSTITGTVTESSDGSPLPRVRIRVVDPLAAFDANDPVLMRAADGSAAVAVTDDAGRYEIDELPPYSRLDPDGGSLMSVIIADEFAIIGSDEHLAAPDPAATGDWVDTSRLVQEFEIDLTPRDVTRDLALLGRYIALAGTISAQDFPGATAGALADARLVLSCISLPDCQAADGLALTTATDGSFEVEVLPAGVYELSIVADGYSVINRELDPIIRFQVIEPDQQLFDGDGNLIGVGVVVTETLIAEPVDIDVTVNSRVAEFGPLTDITVEASYLGPDGADPTVAALPDGVDPYLFSAVSDANGELVLRLPPGEWDLATTDATGLRDGQRPHLDAVRADESVGLRTDVRPQLPFELEPYLELTGLLAGRDVPIDAADDEPLDAGTVFPNAVSRNVTPDPIYSFVVVDADGTTSDPEATAQQTTDQGVWGLLLPPSQADPTDWGLEARRDAYDDALLTVRLDPVSADTPTEEDYTISLGDVADLATIASIERLGTGLPPKLGDEGPVLTATPVRVVVTVNRGLLTYPDGPAISADGLPIANLDLTAAWGGDPALNPLNPLLGFADAYGSTARTWTDGTAVLRLAPGDWAVSTANAPAGYVNRGLAGFERTNPAEPIEVTISPDDGVTFGLAATANLSGTVTGITSLGSVEIDAEGNPVSTPGQTGGLPNVRVDVYGLPSSEDACDKAQLGDDLLRASAWTSSLGVFSITGLVPEYACLVYTEFEANRTVETRLGAEVPVALRSGLNDGAQLLLIAANVVQGVVEGVDGPSAEPVRLEGADVVATGVGIVDAADVTDPSGYYSITWAVDDDDLDPVDITITADREGYDQQTRDVSLPATFFSGEGALQVGLTVDFTGDFALVAQKREVRLTFSSTADGGTLAGFNDPAADIDVILEAQVGNEEFFDDPDERDVLENGDAVSVISGVSPGRYRLILPWNEQDLEQPHVAPTGITINVPAADGDNAVFEQTIDVNRWRLITGVLTNRLIVGGTQTPAAEGTRVTSSIVDDEVRNDSADADGRYRVWVRGRLPANRITLTYNEEGYQPTTFERTRQQVGAGDILDADLLLTAWTRNVTVDFKSGASGGVLTGADSATFTLSNEFSPADPDPDLGGIPSIIEGTVALGADDKVLTVTFSSVPPSPTAWNLAAEDLFELDEPHYDAADLLDVPLWPEETEDRELVLDGDDSISLDRYARYRGTVTTDPGGVTCDFVLEFEYPDDIDRTPADPDPCEGAYLVWLFEPPLPDGDDGKLTFSLEGADDVSLTPTDAERARNVATVKDVTLIASPRDVDVLVVSSVDDGEAAVPLAGVEVTATDDADPAASVTVTTGANGIAAFVDRREEDPAGADDRLAPGTWTFTTSGAGAVTVGPVDALLGARPHLDLVAGDAVTRDVPVGVGALTFDEADDTNDLERLTLERYQLVEGTVSERDYPDASPTSATGVTVSTAVSDALVLTGDASGPETESSGDFRVWAPIFAAGDVISFVKDGYDSETLTIPTPEDDPPFFDSDGVSSDNEVTLTATPIDVEVTIADTRTGDGSGAAVTISVGVLDDATACVGVAPVLPEAYVTAQTIPDGTGNAWSDADTATVTFHLPPGAWCLTVSDGAGHVRESAVSTDTFTFDVEIGETYTGDGNRFEAALVDNSVLYGRVVEDRNGTLVPLSGVGVRAEREGRAYRTTSGDPDEFGDNFALRAESGTWQISAVRNGMIMLIEEDFEIRKDGPDADRNWLEIVLPWLTAEISGRVTDDAGNGVSGATVTAHSAVGTFSAVSDVDGTYRVEGLDPDVPWRVTFTPPPGAVGQAPVTRFLAAGNLANAELVLDQDLPSGYGHLEVQILEAQPGAPLEIELVEQTVFPTMNEEGRHTSTITASSEGTATVRFDDLVPGNGRSIPQNRFVVTAVQGDTTRTASGLEVYPGMTTSAELVFGVVVTRTLELLVSDPDGPVTGINVRLERDPYVFAGQGQHDSNRYRFTDLPVGTWTVLVDGYLPTTVEVPAGEGTLERAIALAFNPDVPREEDEVLEPDDPSEQELDHDQVPQPPADGEGSTVDDVDGGGPVPDADDATEGDPAPGDTESNGGSDPDGQEVDADVVDPAGDAGEDEGSDAEDEPVSTSGNEDGGALQTEERDSDW